MNYNCDMDVVYLDNNATTRPAPEVVQAMLPYLTEWYGNPSSVHRFGQRARQALVTVLPGEDEAQLLPDGLVAHDPPPELIDLERAMARLPETARTIVWMHDVEGMNHEEIAAQFSRSVSFSKSQLSRAHAQLRLQLAEHRPAEPALPAAEIAAQRGFR